ncbi:ABC transporter permease [Chryseosolibacter histidini]|nr:ABC transporter permease [Chryseosolibacter histidini]
MKRHKILAPPKWAQRVLEWYCRPELAEDLQGDLNEYFYRNCETKGVRWAKLNYIVDVFKFVRIYTIRKPEFINFLIHWLMLGSYIKTSGRSMMRNKLFSFINIVGLAISMSVGLLMIAFLSDLLSYDKFHVNHNRIYRVCDTYQNLDQKPIRLASTSVKAGLRIQEDKTGIDEMVLMRNGFGGDARSGNQVVPVGGLWASESFFKVFTFPLLQGNAATALREPYSIVLTEKTAKKIFGDANALGQTILFDTTAYAVTGVMKDIPALSHMHFEMLVSFSTFELPTHHAAHDMKWEHVWSNYVYVVLPEGSDPEALQRRLDKISAEENAALAHTKIKLWLQPMNNIVLGEDLSNQIGPTMVAAVPWVIGILSFVVILSACFNYTNLSIARSLRRSREVGIRKVIGALKIHVLGQFIAEALIISLLALVIAFGIFLLLRPQFMSIAPELANIVRLDLSPRIIAYFLLLAVAVGISAGFLPALFFSRINAVYVLKQTAGVKIFRNVSLRKALIVMQYVFSLAFIAATIIGYRQYRHFLTFDLGFKTENILNIKLGKNNADLLAKELKELPEITNLSRSLMITSVGSYYGENVKYTDPLDSALVYYNSIDEQYLPIHGHRLLAGRNFTAKAPDAEETEIIINEQVMKRFNIGGNNPAKAVGDFITFHGKKLQIIGVLKDFHYGKVDSEISPVCFRYYTGGKGRNGYINAGISTTDLPATMDKIEKAWKKIDPVHPMEAVFYDDQIEKAYSEFSAMIKIIGFLSFLAISIASMGLLGMVVFTTETRLREVSIRKVLGATEGHLIYLLSRGFLLLLAVSALIALPATYYLFDQVFLSDIVHRAPIGISELLLSIAVVMGVALLMIGSQTLRVARSNPADVLKNE